MARLSKSKLLQRYLVRRVMLLEDNMEQWAKVDQFLGAELMLRTDQVAALKANDTTAALEIHNNRIKFLEQALEILRNCPACGPHDQEEQQYKDKYTKGKLQTKKE